VAGIDSTDWKSASRVLAKSFTIWGAESAPPPRGISIQVNISSTKPVLDTSVWRLKAQGMDLDWLIKRDVEKELLIGVALKEGFVLFEDIYPSVFSVFIETLALRLINIFRDISLVVMTPPTVELREFIHSAE